MKARFVFENTRFKRGQDPKHAMGIGIHHPKDFERMYDLIIWVIENYHLIMQEERMEDSKMVSHLISNRYSTKLQEYVEKYLTVEGENKSGHFVWAAAIDVLKNRLSSERMYESVSFERGQNPKGAMGVGILPRIKAAMKSRGYESKTVDQILGFAVDYGHIAFTKYALNNGANANHHNGRFLQRAVEDGEYEIAKMLLKNGASTESVNTNYSIGNIRREALYGGGVKADRMFKIAELLGPEQLA